jgi:hypothetical protein
LYNRKGLCLFCNILVAYGDRQRCRDIVAVVGLQELESGYQEVWLQLEEKGGSLHMEEEEQGLEPSL